MNLTVQQLVSLLDGKVESNQYVHVSDNLQVPIASLLQSMTRREILAELFSRGHEFTVDEVAQVGQEKLSRLAREYLGVGL